jgi:hypothetical protein
MNVCRAVLGIIAGLASSLTATAGYEDAVRACYELADVGDTVVVRSMAGAERGPAGEEYFVFFRFEGVLWCYAPRWGTWVYGAAPAEWPPSDRQVMSWLQEANAGVHHVSIHRRVPAPVIRQANLPHACVIACLAEISNLLVKTGTPDEVGLVLLSYDRQRSPTGRIGPLVVGHSILVYRYDQQWFSFDPQGQKAPVPLTQVAVGVPLDPALKSLADRPDCRIEHARLLRISRRTLDELDSSLPWRLLRQREG